MHKTDEIRKLFDGIYSEEVINKVKNFYFKENDIESEAVRLENTCNVSKLHLFCFSQYLHRICYTYYVFVFTYSFISYLLLK